MASPLVVRRATPDDYEVVMQLLMQRVDWLRAQGSDQWSTSERWNEKIPPSLQDGHVWLLLDDETPIGTITVEFRGDSDFWTPDECAEPAAYLSKLAVRVDQAGAELGALLTDWASDHAYRRGCTYMRLDAWKTNARLHEYYRQRGWTYLRTATCPHRNSGALFQRPARPLEPAASARLEQAQPLTTLPADHRSGYGTDERAAGSGNWIPGHTHNGGVTVVGSWSPNPQPAMFVDHLRYRVTRRDDEWILESRDGGRLWHGADRVVGTDLQVELGSDYVISHQGEHPKCRMVVVAVPIDLVGSCR